MFGSYGQQKIEAWLDNLIAMNKQPESLEYESEWPSLRERIENGDCEE